MAAAQFAEVATDLPDAATSDPSAPAEGAREVAHRAVGHLASLVEEVVDRLENPARSNDPEGLIPACNAALEACLERLREVADRDDLERTAGDDLRRLGRLLKLLDGADVLLVMRQIRRVLGRLDPGAR